MVMVVKVEGPRVAVLGAVKEAQLSILGGTFEISRRDADAAISAFCALPAARASPAMSKID
jgi:hypothetical protein